VQAAARFLHTQVSTPAAEKGEAQASSVIIVVASDMVRFGISNQITGRKQSDLTHPSKKKIKNKNKEKPGESPESVASLSLRRPPPPGQHNIFPAAAADHTFHQISVPPYPPHHTTAVPSSPGSPVSTPPPQQRSAIPGLRLGVGLVIGGGERANRRPLSYLGPRSVD